MAHKVGGTFNVSKVPEDARQALADQCTQETGCDCVLDGERLTVTTEDERKLAAARETIRQRMKEARSGDYAPDDEEPVEET